MIQGRIRAVRFEQALVRALLDDFAMVDDQNHVGLTDGRKPVRNDERGCALHQRVRHRGLGGSGEDRRMDEGTRYL